jgi:hypothetical protein|tara:strand:+ start:2000 stop:2128 length:129 start_codon:yes stop_codon:yes gene_type:complete
MEKQIMKQIENKDKFTESIVDILRRLRKDPEAMKQAKIVSNL